MKAERIEGRREEDERREGGRGGMRGRGKEKE